MIRMPMVLLSVAFSICLGLALNAGAQSVYGQGVSLSDIVSVDEIIAAPDRFEGKDLAVRGLVVDVCSVRGCWLELAGSVPHRTVRVQVQEGVVVIPLDARGRKATVQGRVEVVASSKLTPDGCSGCPSSRGLAEKAPASALSVRIIATGAVIQ